MSAEAADGLLLSDDLLFTSRITGTASALGLVLKVGRDPASLLRLARDHRPRGVLLDLAHPGLDLPAVLAELRDACGEGLRCVAYGSHVDVEGLRAARAAGCDPVLPRSAFVEKLSAELPAWLSARPVPEP